MKLKYIIILLCISLFWGNILLGITSYNMPFVYGFRSPVLIGLHSYIYEQNDTLYLQDIRGRQYITIGSNVDSLGHHIYLDYLRKDILDTLFYGMVIIDTVSNIFTYLSPFYIQTDTCFTKFYKGNIGFITFLQSDSIKSKYVIPDSIINSSLTIQGDSIFINSNIQLVSQNKFWKTRSPFVVMYPVTKTTPSLLNYTSTDIEYGRVVLPDTFAKSLNYVSVYTKLQGGHPKYVKEEESLFVDIVLPQNQLQYLPASILKEVLGDTLLTLYIEGIKSAWEIYIDKYIYVDNDTIINLLPSRTFLSVIEEGYDYKINVNKSLLLTDVLSSIVYKDGYFLVRFYLRAMDDYADFNLYYYQFNLNTP